MLFLVDDLQPGTNPSRERFRPLSPGLWHRCTMRPPMGQGWFHLLAGLAILLGTGRTRAVLAENILLKQQLLQQHQSPQRLRALDLFRSVAGNRPLMSFVLICLAAFQHSPVALDRLAVVQHNAKTGRTCSRHRLILASKTSTRNSSLSIYHQIVYDRIDYQQNGKHTANHRPIDHNDLPSQRKKVRRFTGRGPSAGRGGEWRSLFEWPMLISINTLKH